MFIKILARTVLILAMVCMGNNIAHTEYLDYYLYKSVCPTGPDGKPGGNIEGGSWHKVYDKNGNYLPDESYYVDKWGFAQCNCTSYSSFVLNEYGILFNNNYLSAHWGDGKNWNDAASDVVWTNDDGKKIYQDIIVDSKPIPGDIAYWDNLGGYGHVAWVEKVYYDSNGKATDIDVTEYNFTNKNDFDPRKISLSDTSNRPDGYIHILAFHEGVTSLYYLDCYDMGNICDGQTQEEWGKIASIVWNNYRCKDCIGNYDVAYINSIAGGFGGGSIPPPNPTPHPTAPYPNLRIQSIGVFDPSDHELNEQKDYLNIGTKYAVKVYLVSEEENCINGVDADTENVETDVYVKISNEDSDGTWEKIGRVYTQPSTLTKDNPHKETVYYTIPPEARNKRVYFKAIVDSTKEVHETNEDDNESYWQKEWYPVPGNTDLIISIAQLVGQKTSITMGTNYRIEMAVRNIGSDTPLVGIQSGYYLQKPGETAFTKIEEDGSDASELTPNRDQWENTPTSGYLPDRTGTHRVRVCADIGNTVPETDETNNCKEFSFEVTPAPPTVDLVIVSLGLKEGTSIKKGSKIHPWVIVKNIGTTTPAIGVRVAYYIDNDYRDDDGIDANQLAPGHEQKESVDNDNIKMGNTGTRTLKCCVDYKNALPEIDENNNCASMTFKVK